MTEKPLKTDTDIENTIINILVARKAVPGLRVIKELQDLGVSRAAASRAIAHAVTRGQIALDGQHRLSARIPT